MQSEEQAPEPLWPVEASPIGGVCYVNGRYVPTQEAVLPVNDLAVVRGYAVFESLRTYGLQPFRLTDHLTRLRGSARAVGIPMPWTDIELTGLVEETLARNDLPEAAIRIMVTGGTSRDLYHPEGNPGLIVMALPLRPYPQERYQDGVHVATIEIERYLPQAKTTLYLPGMLAMQQARQRHPDVIEALYVDRHGQVTEGVTSNVFAFVGETLVTPAEDILRGVTRQVVLELAEGEYQVAVRPVQRNELLSAREVFLTGSVKEILPVRMIDGRLVGDGIPGEQTRRLAALYQAMIAEFMGVRPQE